MAEFSIRGGARIGWINASWPFAHLTISPGFLAISTLGSYEFVPAQIVSIERYGSIPFLYSGIRINHNRMDYPEKIIFWCVGGREKVLARIAQTGFLPEGKATVRVGGSPIRWSVILVFVAVWNVLFLLDGSFNFAHPKEPGVFSLVALFLAFAFSTATQLSSAVQQAVVAKGHQIGEIKALLVLLQLVSGCLFVGFGISSLARAYAG